MWPWRQRKKFADIDLPNQCFISHSYKDASTRRRLIAQLPNDVEPVVFPPIVVPPEKAVSHALLEAIDNCGGLIYLKGGASAQSFWVALERDYALRQGKHVFAYDPVANSLSRETSAPISPKVFLSRSQADDVKAELVAQELRARYFDLWFHEEDTPHTTKTFFAIEDEIRERAWSGGYLVVMWSAHVRDSNWIMKEMLFANEIARERVILALLDNTPNSDLSAFISLPSDNIVQLYSDSARSMTQRIDDLIVRLYWLIYRNTRQRQLH